MITALSDPLQANNANVNVPTSVEENNPAHYTVLDFPVTANDVEAGFESILKRSVNADGHKQDLVSAGFTIRQLLIDLRNSRELKAQIQRELADAGGYANLDAFVTERDVEAAFQVILKRPVGNDEYIAEVVSKHVTSRALLSTLRESVEFKNLMQTELERQRLKNTTTQREPTFYRCPQDLVAKPVDVKQIIVIGSCLSTQFLRMRPLCNVEFYLFGQKLPECPSLPVGEYDFQIVQLPLRSVLPDSSFARLKQTNAEAHEKLFVHAANATRECLRQALQWNKDHGILSFIFPFIVPQQNLVGRLMPRYDLRNPVYFVERLNMVLAGELEDYSNCYFFDMNEIMASHGKRYVQEDMVAAFNHGSYLTDFDFDSRHDGDRIEPAATAADLYELRFTSISLAVWEELLSAYRSVRQVDMVKMVVIDLDDTLWRGTVAELDVDNLPTSEGWPIAFWEALQILKRRGILLAIISKNDEARTLEIWDRIVGRHLPLEDITIRRINWLPKSENMTDILAHVNLLPQAVVYVDDNPTQRAEIKAAFPAIRVLGGSPMTWRHIFLWSAETQVVDITNESSGRTEMVRAQVAREGQRLVLSREEFLLSLNVRMTMFAVDNISHNRFPRVLELLNKTNQFNTTGQRWTQEACIASFAAGAKVYAFEVADIYTEYGLVGVLVVDKSGIRQFVMSCRIMGLEAEVAAVAQILRIFEAHGIEYIQAAMVETERNLPCRTIYSQCGFEQTGGAWQRSTIPRLPVPSHIALSLQD